MKQKKTWRCLAGALGLVLLLTGGAAAAAKKAPDKAKKGPQGEFPLHISADRLEADQNERVIDFIGQVKAVYGDTILYADKLRVFYEQPPPGAQPAAAASPQEKKETSPLGDMGGEKINRIVAQGQVRVVQEDKVATGQEATYYRARDEIVLTGNPQLWRAENTLKGERIIFNLKTNKMLVESSAQRRVEAHLYPESGPGSGSGGTSRSTPLKPKGSKPR